MRTPLQPKAKATPIERIKAHLRSYDTYLPPPQYVKPTLLMQQEITQHSLKELKEKLRILTGTAT